MDSKRDRPHTWGNVLWERKERKSLGRLQGGAGFLSEERAVVGCSEASADFHDVILPPSLISGCQCDVTWLTEFLEMNNWLVLAAGKVQAPVHCCGSPPVGREALEGEIGSPQM